MKIKIVQNYSFLIYSTKIPQDNYPTMQFSSLTLKWSLQPPRKGVGLVMVQVPLAVQNQANEMVDPP